jgi:hypothetical protein
MFIGLHLWTIYYLPKYDSVSTGDIILLITVGFVFWYAWETRKMRKEMAGQNEKLANQLRLQTFSEYTKRYQEIILHFPEDINERQFDFGKLNNETRERTMRYMRAYFDLCLEEFWLHEKGFIDEEWWKVWEGGMSTAFNKIAFRNAWEVVIQDTKFGETFINFVNGLLMPKGQSM